MTSVLLIIVYLFSLQSQAFWSPKPEFFDRVRKENRPLVSADVNGQTWHLKGIQLVALKKSELIEKARRFNHLKKLSPLVGSLEIIEKNESKETWKLNGSFLSKNYSSIVEFLIEEQKIHGQVIEGDFLGVWIQFRFLNASSHEAWVVGEAKLKEENLGVLAWVPDWILRLGFEGAMDLVARRLAKDVQN